MARPPRAPARKNTLAPAHALRDEAALFREIVDNVPVAIAYFQNPGFICRFANRLYAQIFGHDEHSILGLTTAQVIGEAAARDIQPHVDRLLTQRTPVTYERQIIAPDGGARHIEVQLLPHASDTSGEVIGGFVLITDVTRQRRDEQALRRSEERLAKFMQASAEGILFHDDGVIVDVNPALLELLGYELANLRGRATADFVAPEERERAQAVRLSGEDTTYESVALHHDGSRIPVELIARTITQQGERYRMVIVRDLRDQITARERIHYLAHHDALTGLPNRADFLARVGAKLAQAEARGATAALLFVDIDRFKRVNDSLGHIAGDALLREVAGRITAALRATDLVARFAGDEFVVLLAGDMEHSDIDEVARKLLEAIAQPVEVDGPSISVTTSIGIAVFPRDSRDPAELLKFADTAMYHAKALGRARRQYFEPAMARTAYDALVLESDLATALRDHQFELHYQPQLRLTDGALAGFEALLRWRHPKRGFVSPDQFVPLAEERRLMVKIGQWVIAQALRDALRWRHAGLLSVPVGVNLTALQFHGAGFVPIVERELEAQGARGEFLEVELTERMLMDDLTDARATLHWLRALGVRVAVDDFGTGTTSLGHLKDLPVDRLKIDRSFIEGLPGDRGAAAIARAIIQMAHGLDLGVVAEGVETEAQRVWLKAEGCGEAQGHLIAHPMDAGEFEQWLRERAAATSVVPSSGAPSLPG
jgi:diguanylate cyclase (GGDEF)-like protein/PAS domain S-box-containing protein